MNKRTSMGPSRPLEGNSSLREYPEASLSDVHRSIRVPGGRWWRRLIAFAGPGYMVSVGYMDPGNWATDLEGGARFGYRLIWVLLLSNMMAVLLQALSARLGLATGRDLAQACRDNYPTVVRWVLYLLCEVAIAAMDLAELLGTAIGLNLLFGIPLEWAVLATGGDVLILLGLQRLGIRKMEAFILALVATIGGCFVLEIFLSKPSWSGVVSGFAPALLRDGQLYIAIGMLGATVMPHNLYLHSSLVQTRNVDRSHKGIEQACRYNLIDSAVALNAAFFVNAAILVLAAAAFWREGIVVNELQQAHGLLDGILGTVLAPIAFAVALICAGQSSTLTGTLAGQITMEGFLHFRMAPWLRRIITRSIAIVPAMVVIFIMGDTGSYRLLILSQVVLSLQLPFAVVPLIKFTSSKTKMGPFASPTWVRVLAWITAAIIVGLNGLLVYEEIGSWAAAAGAYRWLVLSTTIPTALGLLGLLVWLTFRSEELAPSAIPKPDLADRVVDEVDALTRRFRRIGLALEAKPTDSRILRKGLELAREHRADLVLLHVVEGAGGQWYGQQTGDTESREDEKYLRQLVRRLRQNQANAAIPDIQSSLGYGDVVRELVRLSRETQVDLVLVGGHGHRGLGDLIHGQTIPGLRHALGVSVFSVRTD